MSTKQTNKIIKSLISEKKDNQWIEKVDYIEANKEWLDISAKIAIKVIRALRDKNWTQKKLASKLGVRPQQVNKILKGKENLSLKTISNLQGALGLELINTISQTEIDQLIKSEVSKHRRIWQKQLEYVRQQNNYKPNAEQCAAGEHDYAIAA